MPEEYRAAFDELHRHVDLSYRSATSEAISLAMQISLKDQFLYVSNTRLSSLTAFALEVGGGAARSDEEHAWVEKLREFDEGVWSHIDFDLDERFPSVEEKKFWARIYHDVARRIFLRELGNHEVTFWQSSAIGDAYVIGRMLTRAVHEVEQNAWRPDTENGREAEEHQNGRINVRL